MINLGINPNIGEVYTSRPAEKPSSSANNYSGASFIESLKGLTSGGLLEVAADIWLFGHEKFTTWWEFRKEGGAWQRYGFHEDGLLSAVNLASGFGIKPPWLEPETEPAPFFKPAHAPETAEA